MDFFLGIAAPLPHFAESLFTAVHFRGLKTLHLGGRVDGETPFESWPLLYVFFDGIRYKNAESFFTLENKHNHSVLLILIDPDLQAQSSPRR